MPESGGSIFKWKRSVRKNQHTHTHSDWEWTPENERLSVGPMLDLKWRLAHNWKAMNHITHKHWFQVCLQKLINQKPLQMKFGLIASLSFSMFWFCFAFTFHPRPPSIPKIMKSCVRRCIAFDMYEKNANWIRVGYAYYCIRAPLSRMMPK